MAPMPKKTIEHFTHPNHQLLEINDDNDYLCNGCKTPGTGNRFRCHGCDFNLHEYCGICPMTLSSFLHPQHQLHIVLRQAQATRQNDRICDVCGDSVEGIFYRCNICEFDVHPLCTQLPQQVNHILHPAHPLTLQQFPPSRCLICKSNCTSWRYGCGICGVGIHLECLLTAFDASTSTSTLTSTSTPPPAPLTSITSSASAPTPPPVQRSVWQPSSPAAASPLAFGTYGYQMLPFGNAYAYGVQNPPAFGGYGHQIPPPFGSAYASGVQAPLAFGPYGYQISPFGSAYASGVQAPPVGAYNNQYGMPIVYSASHMYHDQHPSGNQQVGGGGYRKRIDRILGALALGVVSNGVSDFILDF